MTRESAVSLGRDIDFDGSAGGTKLLGITVRPTEVNQEFLLWVTLIGREKRSGPSIATFEVNQDLVTLATATLRPDSSPDHFLVSTTHDDLDAVEFTLRAQDAGGDAEMLAGTSLVVESPKADFTVIEKFSAREKIGSVGDLTLVWDPPNDCIRATWTAAEHASYHMWRHDQGTGNWTEWTRDEGDDNEAIISSPTRGTTYNIEVRGHRSEDDFGPTATADVDVPPASRLTSYDTSHQTSRTTRWTTSYLTWYETCRDTAVSITTSRETYYDTCWDTAVPITTSRETCYDTCWDTRASRTTYRDTYYNTCWKTQVPPVTRVTQRETSRQTCHQTAAPVTTRTTGRDTTRQTSRITEPLPPEPERETTYDTTYFTSYQTTVPGGNRQTCWTTTWTTKWTTIVVPPTTRQTCRRTGRRTAWTTSWITRVCRKTCHTTSWTTQGTRQTCRETCHTTSWTTQGTRETCYHTCHTTTRETSGTTRYLTSYETSRDTIL